MTIRVKLGRNFSIGKSGVRAHFGGRNFAVSTGTTGTRLFMRLGALYGLWGSKK